MLHARKDYMRFQDPALEDPTLLGEGATPIKQDEPVMLFRAQDKHFINLLMHYVELVESEEIKQAVCTHVARAAIWQRENKTKEPDL